MFGLPNATEVMSLRDPRRIAASLGVREARVDE